MNKELPKAYNPKDYEDSIYQKWEDSGFFNPEKCIEGGVTKEDAESFSMVLPPPNVTGRLHAGHAVMLAIQDSLARYHRMKGDRTLWLPGTDHAAIATQSKVEKIIFEKSGKSRFDLGREAFLTKVEKFAKDSHDTIILQTKKMGASLDWSREAYTLDEKRTLAVRTAFKKMYDEGIIYRGHRIVNWDPKMQTTVSDDELEHREEKTTLYYLQYGPFVISTARPETKFGDKYVVMHPKDERYKEYAHGQQLEAEWINGPVTATVIKDESINMEFGTGVMTITPWHDMVDFEIAERHHLDKEPIIDFNGKLLPIAGEFAGLDIKEARAKIVAKLESKGLVVKTETDYVHNIATNSRGGGVIEPQIKEQWFVAVNKEFERDGKQTTLKTLMHDAVASGKIEIIPDRFRKIYFHWIDNLRDWCISRQIWYGHRIPVWYRDSETYCGVEAPEGEDWKQDPDTLDTWFSSGLWTFSTLGWPKETNDLNLYHPTSVLETGYDILFFWVARMVLMSSYFMEEIPFKKVYLHGLVRDEKGRKMSKSLGNIIDPLDVIEKYGTDAVRLSLMVGSTPGNDLKLSEEKIASFRNFTNKLWNIGKYILSKIESSEITADVNRDNFTAADWWILNKFNLLIKEVTDDIEKLRLSQAGEKLRDFTWSELADWYIEISKFEENQTEKKWILKNIFEDLLKLWHPFMPFVTETLWENIGNHSLLLIEKWPSEKWKQLFSQETPHSVNGPIFIERYIIGIITAVRNFRAEQKMETQQKISIYLNAKSGEDDISVALQKNESLLKSLRTYIKSIGYNVSADKTEDCIKIPVYAVNLLISPEGIVDNEKQLAKAKKEAERLEKYIASLSIQLKNKDFLKKARESKVMETKLKLEEAKKKLAELNKK